MRENSPSHPGVVGTSFPVALQYKTAFQKSLNILYDGPYDPHPKAGVVKYFREISYFLSQYNSVFSHDIRMIRGVKTLIYLHLLILDPTKSHSI